ncbi:MAG: TolC family protein, partial [Thermodesulfovibrionales bacterium]|nr:TolC family protein [Thermodesulfovibrionales bacterium]
ETESKVDIESLNLNSSREDFQFTRSQVIYNVKKAYYSAIQSKNALEVAKYVLKQYYQHYTKAKGFYEAGMKPRYELTKAEVDLSSSKVNLLKADNNYRIAMTNLKNAIAIYDAPDFEIADEPILIDDLQPVDDLIKKAFQTRQDYRSLELREMSQQKRIDYEKTGYYPFISANARYGYSGDKIPLDKSWLVGANLTVPIFSGFQTKYQVDEALSTLSVIQAQKESLRQKIVLEVRQAYLNAIDARQRLDSSEVTLRYAEENFELATGRYEAGVGSPIEVTDAITVYSNARNSYITAKYDLLTAIADLKRAVGIELDKK